MDDHRYLAEWAKENLRIRIDQNAFTDGDGTVYLEVHTGDTWETISYDTFRVPFPD